MSLHAAPNPEGTNGDGSRPDVLDEMDKALIRLLQKDGRMSFADLAREVSLSQNATRLRVQRLRESGVVDIVAITNPLTVGFETMAMAGIEIGGPVREAATLIESIRGVSYVAICSGRYDLLVELVCDNDAQLVEIVDNDLRTLPAVRRVELFTYLDLKKQTYAWGTR
jgi:Lrp/AsnC family transcriptional regulator, regulator for asnA, asnC and gidA